MVAVRKRTTLTAVVSVAASVAIALAVYGRGCNSNRDTAEAAATQFLTASKAGDAVVMYELMSESTQRELRKAARLATERVGGSRRFEAIDMIRVAATEDEKLPRLTFKERSSARVVFRLEGAARGSDAELFVVQQVGRGRIDVPGFRAEPAAPAHRPPVAPR